MCVFASNVHYTGTGLNSELPFFEYPLAVVVHESEVARFDRQSHCFSFAGLEFDFLKRAQAAIIRCQRRYHISAEKHHNLLAGTVAGVGDIDCENEVVINIEFRFGTA